MFDGLSRKEREQVARWADEIDVKDGKVLAREGDLAYEFFVIRSGTAKVEAGGKLLRNLGSGDVFGEIALMETERRTATVTATSPMALIVMNWTEFHRATHDLPELAARLRELVAERLATG